MCYIASVRLRRGKQHVYFTDPELPPPQPPLSSTRCNILGCEIVAVVPVATTYPLCVCVCVSFFLSMPKLCITSTGVYICSRRILGIVMTGADTHAHIIALRSTHSLHPHIFG